MPDRDAALRVLGEQGWRLLVDAGIALDEAGDAGALAAATRLAARRPDATGPDRAAALELVTAGQALASKLGIEQRLLAVRDAVEQSTPARVATWHAHQIPAGSRVLEIGCGCGSDSLALAHRAANLIATDIDPVRAACTHMNLMAFGLGSARAIPGDGLAILAEEGQRADVVFADPDRRPGGKRTLDPEAWGPPLSTILALAGGDRAVFVKAAPSLDPDAVRGCDIAYVSHRGECVEAFVSASPSAAAGAAGGVRAVLLPDDGPSVVLEGDRQPCTAADVGESVYTADPAAIRASLLAELGRRHGLQLLSEGVALFSGVAGVETPWLAEYRVRDRIRLHPTDLRAALVRLPGGFGGLRIHSRAVSLTAPELQHEVRRVAATRGAPMIDVFATRVLGAPTALLTQRV